MDFVKLQAKLNSNAEKAKLFPHHHQQHQHHHRSQITIIKSCLQHQTKEIVRERERTRKRDESYRRKTINT